MSKPIHQRYRGRAPNAYPACSTFSRGREMWGDDPAIPESINEGKGAYVRAYRTGSRWYLDWVCALGANLLGYRYVGWLRRVSDQVGRGGTFSLVGTREIGFARRLAWVLSDHVPGWGLADLGIRYGLNGSDACNMAVRLARAVTGRKYVANFGYHGWGDTFVSATPPAWGVLAEESQYILQFPFNDTLWFEKLEDDGRADDLACIILEQPIDDPNPGYYDFLRGFCDEHHILLIMDEVVTGFRYALGGACEKFKVFPDLACYGKGISNGIPFSFLAGRRDYMDWFARVDPVFCSGTYMGSAIGTVAAEATLHVIESQPVIPHLYQIGASLKQGLLDLGYDVRGHDPRTVFFWQNDYEKAFFTREMARRGILMNRPNFACYSHTQEDVEKTLWAAAEIAELANNLGDEGIARAMEGHLPKVLFRNR